MSAPKWLLLMPVSPGRVPVTFFLSQRLSKNYHMCLTQPPFKLLSVLWDLKILCVPFKAGVAFPVAFWLSHMQAQLAYKARLSEGLSWCSLQTDTVGEQAFTIPDGTVLFSPPNTAQNTEED